MKHNKSANKLSRVRSTDLKSLLIAIGFPRAGLRSSWSPQSHFKKRKNMTVTELSELPGKTISVLQYQRFVVVSVLKRQLHVVDHCSVPFRRLVKFKFLLRNHILCNSGLPEQLPLHDKSIQIKLFGGRLKACNLFIIKQKHCLQREDEYSAYIYEQN